MPEEMNASVPAPPGIRMNRMQLTAILVGVPAFFVSVAMILSFTGTVLPERKLDADIHLSVETWVPPKGRTEEARLYACAVLFNPTSETWRNVAISINKQFYHYEFRQLGPQETLVVPLEHFVTKGGNITFRPATQKVDRLTVFAQLPSGERAVFDELQAKSIEVRD